MLWNTPHCPKNLSLNITSFWNHIAVTGHLYGLPASLKNGLETEAMRSHIVFYLDLVWVYTASESRRLKEILKEKKEDEKLFHL